MSTCRNAGRHWPIEYSFLEIPSVELIYELVQVELKIFGLDLVIGRCLLTYLTLL